MADFEMAATRTLELEGGYTRGDGDYGGETKFGISKRAHPDIDILNLTQEKAREIYKREYWDKLSLDKINDQLIAEEAFDTAVNLGWKRAAVILQSAVNLIRMAVKANPISIDGLVGPQTIGAANSAASNAAQVDVMLKIMNGLQLQHYMDQMADPNQAKYFLGWVRNRIGRLS